MSLLNICKDAGIQFDINNKIVIPSWVKHIKFDIGLSYNAPHSQIWITNEPDTLVFGFEPNPDSIEKLISPSNMKKYIEHNDVLHHSYINKNFFLIPIALSDKVDETVPFYVTKKDECCSSLLKPLNVLFDVEKVIYVPVFTLQDFFELLPLDTIPYIEYIKIDVQGMDLNVIKGAGKYLSEKVVFVTAECECYQYEDADHNTIENMYNYMTSLGFKQIAHPNCIDPTFINERFVNQALSIFISQNT